MKTFKMIANGAVIAALAAIVIVPAVAANADDCRPAQRVDFHRNGPDRDGGHFVQRDFRNDNRDVHFVAPRDFRDSAHYYGRETVVVQQPFGGYHEGPTALQNNKNTARNVAIAGVGAAIVGVATHNTGLAAAGVIGAVVGGSQYQRDSQIQNNRHFGW